MKLSQLSKFSLDGNKSTDAPDISEAKVESKKLKDIADRKAYIEPKENGCPVFHLKGTRQGSEEEFYLTLSFYEDLTSIACCLHHKDKFSYHANLYGIEELSKQNSLSNSVKQYTQNAYYLNALYFLFHVDQIPISLIKENAKLLDKFVADSCAYFGHSKEYFDTDIASFLNSLPIEKVGIETFEKETQRKNEFVILGRDDSSRGLPCLGIVGLTENYAYLKTKVTESYKFNYPKEFHFDKTSRCTAVFAASLISILLVNAGFFTAGDVLYRNIDPDYKSDLPSYCFCGRRVFTCFDTDSVLTSADIFQIDK